LSQFGNVERYYVVWLQEKREHGLHEHKGEMSSQMGRIIYVTQEVVK